MTVVEFVVLLIIAAICGAIGQALAGYSLGGLVISAVLGFIGAWVGVWLATQFGLPEIFTIQIGGETFPIVWAIIGSAILAAIAGLFFRRRDLSY